MLTNTLAPPYVAGRSDHAPMTQYRQIIEADALSLFSSAAPSSLQHISDSSSVSVPAVLYHDRDAYVLVLSDFGRLPNLSDVFGDLGGHTFGIETPKFYHDLIPAKTQNLTTDQTAFFRNVGSRLGQFFSCLHRPESCAKALAQYPPNHFRIPEIRDAVLELAITPVGNQIQLFPDLASREEARTFAQWLVEDFKRETLGDERSFILGDSWTGAVLTSSRLIPNNPTAYTVGVIDWEFAGIGRGVHGDMSQFLAHLELLRISAQQNSVFLGHLQAVEIMIDSLTSAYSRASGTEKDHSYPRDKIQTLRPRDSSCLAAKKMRSAFLSHGAEMINVAFWKEWVCVSSDCPGEKDGQHTKTQHECILVRRMVEQGLWYLRHACKDVVTFCLDKNWKDIDEKADAALKADRKWLIDLF
jgi:hypothetical protein